jgi:hypothetical protein
MKKLLLSLVVVSLFASVSPAFAAEECTTTTGSYGQTSTTCKVLGETTTVTHQVVEAGIGDISFWTLAQILTMASVAGFGLSKLAERTYWFD